MLPSADHLTYAFTILEPPNPWIYVSELHKKCCSSYLQALTLRMNRPGRVNR